MQENIKRRSTAEKEKQIFNFTVSASEKKLIRRIAAKDKTSMAGAVMNAVRFYDENFQQKPN